MDCFVSITMLPPLKSQPSHSSPFRYEMEFTGYAYYVVVNLVKCHAGIHIQCGSIVNIANLNTEEGKYIIDACQLIHKGLFFSIHYCLGDGQGFTSADDHCHYLFILIVFSTYCLTTESPLLQLLLKLEPKCSFFPMATLKFLLLCLYHFFIPPKQQQDPEKTPKTSLDLDFLPLPSPQSQQYPDDFLDITDNGPFADAQRKCEFWYGGDKY